MKNFGKIFAVILGFLVVVGLLLFGGFELAVWNAGMFIACMCIIAGLLFMYFIVSKSKEVFGKATIGAWISGSLFLLAYSVLIPIWAFNLDNIWIAYLVVGLIGLGAVIWLIEKFIQIR